MKNKNKKYIESFNKYCNKHPEERFWQALRNWSESPSICFVNNEGKDIKDTFYFEGKTNE